MSEPWFKKFGFEANPYQLSPPWEIPEKRIEWNRDDLQELKHKVDEFIKEAAEGYETSLRIWGPWRSGKTWLARYMAKRLSTVEGSFILKTEIFEYDPSLNTFYKKFIDSLLKSNWITRMSQLIEDPQKSNGWKNFFGRDDLGEVICNIFRDHERKLSEEWLRGEKLKSGDMTSILVKANIDSLYDKFEVFKTIIKKSQESFSTFVLVVDQLEAAKGRIAQGFSDLFRELLDSFYEKFALILISTMESIEEWYDMNFSPALEHRIKYTAEMGVLKKEYIPSFLRKHHEVYRIEDWNGEDQINPFIEDSIMYLADRMKAQYMYPNFLLKNCGIVVGRLLRAEKAIATKEIIKAEENRLEYMIKEE